MQFVFSCDDFLRREVEQSGAAGLVRLDPRRVCRVSRVDSFNTFGKYNSIMISISCHL